MSPSGCERVPPQSRFLGHGSLQEDVFVCQPEWFLRCEHSKPCPQDLKKALYGLKKSKGHGTIEFGKVSVDDIIFGIYTPLVIPQLFSGLHVKPHLEMSNDGDNDFFSWFTSTPIPLWHSSYHSPKFVLESSKKYRNGLDCDPLYIQWRYQNDKPCTLIKMMSPVLDANKISLSNEKRNEAPQGDQLQEVLTWSSILGEEVRLAVSKKQDCTVLLTAEAEYVSLSVCLCQSLMRTQLRLWLSLFQLRFNLL
ncbi:hypothetical protein Tco_1300496 [Tanacetum coccineum]